MLNVELAEASVTALSQPNFSCCPILPALSLTGVVPESTPPTNTCTQTSISESDSRDPTLLQLVLGVVPGSRFLSGSRPNGTEGLTTVVGGVLTILACDKGTTDQTFTHREPKWDTCGWVQYFRF